MIDVRLKDLELHVPTYDFLKESERKKLLQELRDWRYTNVYWSGGQHCPLQGDCFNGVPFVRMKNDGCHLVRSKGMMISNTCDMDVENKRKIPISVCFAPILDLKKTMSLLKSKYTTEQLGSLEADIRAQQITNIFYLPETSQMPEGFVSLDSIQSAQLGYVDLTAGSRVASLSQSAFYLFLIKLSIHFTRVGEGVGRYDNHGNDPA